MGAFADYLAAQQAAPEAPAAPVDDTPGRFTTGLRGGMAQVGGQLQALAGTAAEAAGLPGVAQDAYTHMHQDQAEAADADAQIPRFKDIHDIRSGYDWLSGTAGEFLPAAVGGVVGGLAGRTPVGRVVGAALGMAPQEAGDIAQRQQADPVAAATPAGQRLLQAGVGGVASGAAMSVLPGAVGGKLAGAVEGGLAGAAERSTVGQVLARGARELPEAAAVNAGGMALGEAAKQTALQQANPDAQYDPEAVKEAALAGAAGALPLHAVGIAGEAAHAAVRAPGNALSGVAGKVRDAAAPMVQAARDRFAGEPDAAAPAASEVPGKVNMPDPVEAIKGLYDKGTQSARAFWDRVASGDDVADVHAVAGKTAEQIKDMLPGMDDERVQRVAQAAKDLMDKAGLDEGRRAQLAAAMQDLTNRGNQAIVAGIKKGADVTSDFTSKVSDLYDAFKKRPVDVQAHEVQDNPALPAPKMSEDYSGADRAVAQAIVPLVQKANPDLFTDSAAMTKAGAALREALTQMRDGGELGSTQVAKLIDVFGDQSANILEAAHKALHGSDAGQGREDFYRGLKAVSDYAGKGDKTLDFMMRSMKPELQDTVRSTDVRRELELMRHVVERARSGSAEASYKLDQLRSEMRSRYGDNADKVLAMVEKETKPAASVLADEDVSQLHQGERSALGDSIYYGPEKGGLALHPEHDPAGEKGQAVQALARAKKQNPDRTSRFVDANELGHDHPDVQTKLKELQAQFVAEGKDPAGAARMAKEAIGRYGMVAAEGKSEPGAITKDNIRQIQVKDVEGVGRSKYNQASVFKVGNTSYDAIALTKLVAKQFTGEFNAADERGALNRNARMFMTGIAALQDHLGKAFHIPDDLVIDHQGTTFAKVKSLDLTPRMKGEGGEHETSNELNDKLRSLRNEHLKLQREAAGLDDTKEADTKKLVELVATMQAVRNEAVDVQAKMQTADHAERLQRVLEDDGRYEADQRGPIHEQGGKPEPITTNETGNSREKDQGLGGALPKDAETIAKSGEVKLTSDVLREKLQGWADKPPSAAAKAIAEKGLALLDNKGILSPKDKKGLAALLSEGTKASQVAGTINALHEKYAGKLGAKVEAETPKAEAPKAEAPKDHAIDKDFAKETYPEFKTEAEAKQYLLDAYRRFGELAAEDTRVLNDENHPTNELPAAQRAAYFKMAEMFGGGSHADLGSFLPGDLEMSGGANAKLRAYLKSAAPEVAAKIPKSFSSLQKAGTAKVDPAVLKDIRAYVDRVLGPTVKTTLAHIQHAGEYVNDTIRISVHALNPTTVAYHEALHGFFDKLLKQGNGEVARTLERAAMAAPVQNQLKALLAGEHAALAQLKTPEESAAYMYQFWAAGKLKLGTQAEGFFGKLKNAIAKVLGVWTQDQRAEAIMDYFHSGEFQTKGLGQQNAVTRALLKAGRNELLDKAQKLTQPLVNLSDAISTAGGKRLRDTGIPALRQLADMMKVTGRESSDDHGFIPAARIEKTRVMNELAQSLKGFGAAHLDDALEAMQSGGTANTPEGRLVQRAVQGPDGLLPKTLAYMKAAGVDVASIAPRPDYFPRLYDAHYIARHQDEFKTVLERHGLTSKQADAVTTKLAATNGAEFTIETDSPGMQFMKERKFRDIPDAELAPFMRKNMFEILGSYVTQATRRAEWARRFNDDGSALDKMMQQAKAQGATPDQLKMASKFVRGVDGTLGDSGGPFEMTPTLRRAMGNMIVYQNMRLLPMAIFSSVVDPLGIAVRGGTVRDAWSTFKRGIREIPSAFKNEFHADAETELAATLGVIDHATLSDAVGQAYTQGLVGDGVRKWNDRFFRWNLMEGFNRSMRVGATQAAIRFLARHQSGEANVHSKRWLAELGLQPGFTMDLADPKVRAAVNMWVDGAVLRPDQVDKPIWMNDPHYMLISHLKQFTFSFQETILKRVAHEFEHGNYAPAMALASYVPTMIAADLVKGMIQGGGQQPQWKQDWGPEDYLASGVERAGLLGKQQFRVDGPGMMLGPTGQQALGLAKVLEQGKPLGPQVVKALPGEALFGSWLGADGSRVENNMAVD